MAKLKSPTKFPASIERWERETGFEATNSREQFAAGLSLRKGFALDLEWFRNWSSDCLLKGDLMISKLDES